MIKHTLLVMLIVYSGFVFSQEQQEENVKLRHIPGISGFDFAIGINKYGHQYSIGYAQYESKKLIGRVSLNSEHGKITNTNYSSNTIFVGVDYTLVKVQDKLFLNAGGGGLAGWETTSNEVFNKKTDTFLYGVFIGVNIEAYIFNKLAFLLEFKEIYDNGSSLGQFRYYANTGFRFYL